MDVVTPSTVEVLRLAGGWMFDRVLAGWDVRVLAADQGGIRPLRILGANEDDLETMLTSAGADPCQQPQTLAVAVLPAATATP